jgi:hypothetical protein
VVTCIALGWPTPTIGWVRNVGDLTDTRIISDSAQIHPDPAVVSAKLQWLGGFLESDAGNYTCVVQASDTDASSSKVVSIKLSTETLPTVSRIPCSVSSQDADFQVRVLDTDCQMWGADTARDFIRGVASAECQDCVITTQDIQIEDVPTCNEQERTVTVRGTVSTESPSRTQNVFCALNRWQQSGPLIVLDDRIYLIDSNLPLMAGATSQTTSAALSAKVALDIIVIPIVGGMTVAIISIISFWCWYYIHRKTKMNRLYRIRSRPSH